MKTESRFVDLNERLFQQHRPRPDPLTPDGGPWLIREEAIVRLAHPSRISAPAGAPSAQGCGHTEDRGNSEPKVLLLSHFTQHFAVKISRPHCGMDKAPAAFPCEYIWNRIEG